MRTNRLLLAWACLGLGACASTAPDSTERSAVPEGINDRFLSAELNPDEWASRWEAESREVCALRDEIVAAIGITPGSTVVDVGAGTGLFVAPFAEAVGPEGRVLAVDIAPAFVAHLTERSREEGFSNVQARLSQERSLGLKPGSAHYAFVCDTYHHFEYHEDMLDSLFRTLHSGGELVIVDFERIPGVSREWILGHVRAGKQEVTQEVVAAGFVFVEEVSLPGLQENYWLRFRKP